MRNRPSPFIADIYDPATNEPYIRCPRSIAKKAQKNTSSTPQASARTRSSAPKPKVLRVRRCAFLHSTRSQHLLQSPDSEEGPHNSGRALPEGNLGHRPRVKGGYFPVNPVDHEQDLRTEMVSIIKAMGVEVEKHHHEVAASQHELGIKFSTLTKCADNMQIYKYVVHNVAATYGKTATFMPKPVFGDNGFRHACASIDLEGQRRRCSPARNMQACPDFALHYIGGIIKHAKALNAITNPTTNSYKRLVPGYEAPVLLAYSSRNRSASCRIPYVYEPEGQAC